MQLSARAILVFSFLLVSAFLGVGAVGESRQTESGSGVESRTADRIREAWAEIHELQRAGESAEAKRRQEALATQFFESYLAAPETTPGQQALATAFRMWGRTGDDEAIEAAMARIDRGSRHWLQLIQLARPAFVDGERLDDYRGIVTGLAADLTDPEVASDVWIALGRDYRSSGDLDRAGDCFRRAVALDAHPRLVDAARTALRSMDRLAVGRSAPGFTATDLQGQRVSLADLRGRFVLLLFWTSECTDCLREIDHLRWVRAAYPREQLELIGVALDSRAEDALRVVEVRKIDWPQIHDEEAMDGPVARLYEAREVPRSFLIDPQGLIVAKQIAGEDLDALLAELLPQDRGDRRRLGNASTDDVAVEDLE
jgi:peroxiredoxin